MSKKPQYYSQKDARWGKNKFSSVNNSSQTIASSGCGPTSMAMVAAQFFSKSIIPSDCAKDVLTMGFRTPNAGTDWAYFKKAAAKYGLKYEQTYDTNKVYNMLSASKGETLVIASMGKGYWTSGGHYIVLYDAKDNYIYANDPASINRTKASKTSFSKERKTYFIFTKVGYKAPTTTTDKPVTKITRRTLSWKNPTTKKVRNPLQSGDDVKNLQSALFYKITHNISISIDGKFGENTDKLVKRFQTLHKLAADGVVGEKTWKEIDKLKFAVVKKGSKGNDVKILQQELKYLKYNISVNGTFDSATEKVVKEFQKKYGLNIDGIVGSLTWGKLRTVKVQK